MNPKSKDVGTIKRGSPILVWVYFQSLVESLDRATWLETSAELCDLGWHVILIAVDFPQNQVDKRITTVSLPRPRWYLLGYIIFHLLLLFHIIFDYREADVILFHQPAAPFLYPLLLLRKLFGQHRPKFVMDSRTVNMVTSSWRGRLWGLFFNIVNFLANRLADGQTSITARLAQLQGIPDQQLLGTWPSGVKLERFKLANLRRRWPSKDEPLRLIYIGALYQNRNLLALIEAVRVVGSEGYNIILDLVGEGPQKIELEVSAHQPDDGAIRVCSAVQALDIPKTLATAHIGVLPFPDLPIFQVSSPIKLFEYMAAGMPILATKVACHTDVFGDSDFVFWAEDGNPTALAAAIRMAYTRKAELRDMGQNASIVAKNYTWKRSAELLNEALRKVL
jgi:glycosyltransferase involved in cell wall biosynthesis